MRFSVSPTTLAVLGDSRRLLEKCPELFRPGFDQAGDRALLDDGVASRSETGAEKHVHHVTTAALGGVQEVLGVPLATDLALDRDLRVGGESPSEAPVAVVEHELHRGLRERLAGVGAGEHDIGHGSAAKMAGGELAHDPAHRVDDVRLATAVRTDNADQIAGKGYRGGVDEGLEARQPDLAQAHLL